MSFGRAPTLPVQVGSQAYAVDIRKQFRGPICQGEDSWARSDPFVENS